MIPGEGSAQYTQSDQYIRILNLESGRSVTLP